MIKEEMFKLIDKEAEVVQQASDRIVKALYEAGFNEGIEEAAKLSKINRGYVVCGEILKLKKQLGNKMPYDDRLIIKERFTSKQDHEGTNIIKLIEYDEFVQVYLKNGHGASRGIRLDRPMLDLLIKFLNNVEVGVDKIKKAV